MGSAHEQRGEGQGEGGRSSPLAIFSCICRPTSTRHFLRSFPSSSPDPFLSRKHRWTAAPQLDRLLPLPSSNLFARAAEPARSLRGSFLGRSGRSDRDLRRMPGPVLRAGGRGEGAMGRGQGRGFGRGGRRARSRWERGDREGLGRGLGLEKGRLDGRAAQEGDGAKEAEEGRGDGLRYEQGPLT